MYWNQDRVDAFVHAVSSGFVPASPWDVLEAAIYIGAIFLLYTVVVRFVRMKREQGFAKISDRSFERAASDLDLRPSELDLVERLARTLPHPERERHLLLAERSVFFRARRELLIDYPELVRDLESLALRIGFAERLDGARINTTYHLQNGSLLWGSTNLDEPPLVRVERIATEAIRANILNQDAGFRTSVPSFRLFFRRNDGMYAFDTSILTREADGIVVLSHSMQVERVQNRRFERRDVDLSAMLADMPVHVVNLGGGGARVRSSLRRVNVDDDLPFVLQLPGVPEIRLVARVVAVKDRSVHLHFVKIREGDRDRIVRFLRTAALEASHS